MYLWHLNVGILDSQLLIVFFFQETSDDKTQIPKASQRNSQRTCVLDKRKTVEFVTSDEDNNYEDLSPHHRKLRWIKQLGGQKLVDAYKQQERQRSFIRRLNRTEEQRQRDNAKAKIWNERYREKMAESGVKKMKVYNKLKKRESRARMSDKERLKL